LLVNDEKCVWQPTQSLTWLGLNWNGDTGTISITSKRIEKVDKALRNLVSHPKTSARKLPSAVGMIISMGPVMDSLKTGYSPCWACAILFVLVDNYLSFPWFPVRLRNIRAILYLLIQGVGIHSFEEIFNDL
jgi:hypothetical protein